AKPEGRGENEAEKVGRVVGQMRLKTEKPLPDLATVEIPAENSLDESLVFSKEGGVANVFVYLWKPNFAAAAQQRDVTEPFVLKSDLKHVSPRVAIVPVGQSIVVDRRLATENTNFHI